MICEIWSNFIFGQKIGLLTQWERPGKLRVVRTSPEDWSQRAGRVNCAGVDVAGGVISTRGQKSSSIHRRGLFAVWTQLVFPIQQHSNKMKATIVVLLLVHFVTSIVATEEGLERESKVLPIFQVVRFPNDVCTGTTRNGTCFTA